MSNLKYVLVKITEVIEKRSTGNKEPTWALWGPGKTTVCIILKEDKYLDYYIDEFLNINYIIFKGTILDTYNGNEYHILKFYEKAYELYRNDQFDKRIQEIVDD